MLTPDTEHRQYWPADKQRTFTRMLKAGASARKIATALGITVEDVNNRLAYMRRMGNATGFRVAAKR